MSFLFKNFLKKFFLWNTNNTDKNGVNRQNAHTHIHTKHLEKDNIGKGGGVPTMSLAASEFLFLTMQKKQVMMSPHFEKISHVTELQVKKISLNVPDFLLKILSSS